jgi:hypothetical protein
MKMSYLPQKKTLFEQVLLYDFSFLPTQILGVAFSTFYRGTSISCPAVATDFHIESVLLSKGFFDWI